MKKKKSLFNYVSELVKTATEDSRATEQGLIQLKLEKEKSDIVVERRFTQAYDKKVKEQIIYCIEKYAVQHKCSGSLLFSYCTQKELDEISKTNEEFYNFAKNHLDGRLFNLLSALKSKGVVTAYEATSLIRSEFSYTSYVLERLYQAGYIEKENREGKEVYISKDIIWFGERVDRVELQDLYEQAISKGEEQERKQNEEFVMQVKQAGEGEREETGKNFFKYAKEHLDADSFKVLFYVYKNNKVDIKQISKHLKCKPERARYLSQRLYETGYIEKFKIKNQNVYTRKF